MFGVAAWEGLKYSFNIYQKIIMKKIYLIIITLISVGLSAQDLTKIKINGWLCCNLHSALTDISEKHGVMFKYDIEKFKKIQYTDHPLNKSLALFLEQICKKNKLKYYYDNDNVITFVDRWLEVEENEMAKAKRYEHEATKKDFTVSGRVYDVASHESLPFVNVRIKGTTLGTTANVDGYFTLLKVPYDTSTLMISYIGYESDEIQLNPGMDVNNIEIELKTDIINLDEVIVTADRQEILQISGKHSSIIKMSPIKLNSLPNIGEKDVFRSFQLMPGISAANENSSGLYVRGGTPDQVLVQYDGFTVYNVEHLFGFFSAFNSNAIKDIQLYKGGFDTKFGGRLASVVEITGKEGNQKEFNAAADVGLMSLNGFIESPLGSKVTFILAGRRSWKSSLYNKIFDLFVDDNGGSEENSNNGPVRGPGPGGGPPGGGFGPGGFGMQTEQETKSYFYDINSKITYRPNDKNTIVFSIYNGKDNLDNSFSPSSSVFGRFQSVEIDNTDITKWGNTGASLKWSNRATNKLYFNFLVSYSNYFSYSERTTSGGFTFDNGGEGDISRGNIEDNNLLDYTAKSDFEYKLAQNNQLEFGAQLIHNKIDYSYTQNDTIQVIQRSTNGQLYSGYVQDKITLFGTNFTMTPGIRFNYFTETQQNYLEPRFNFMYKINKRFKIKGATGRYYQFAKRVVREDITQGSRDFWVLSDNENLPVSSSNQFILGTSYETPDYLFDVEAFYKRLSNVTEYSLRFQPERGNRREMAMGYTENFFTGTGIAKGIDFLAQKKFGDFNGWLAYTWSQVTNNIEEFGDYDYYAAHDVTHEFKSVLMYKWRVWDLGATWIYASGRPYTSPEGYYELTLLDGSTANYINATVKNGKRFPAYHRLDFSVTLNFQIKKKLPATLGLSIFNVYNRTNIWYAKYEVIENTIIETPVYFLGITPNINLTIKLH